MRELDLHGMRYEDARRAIEQFLNSHHKWSPIEQGEIITGYSQNMRELVITLLGEYNIDYDVGGPLKVSETFIRIY